jgi:hypothetical protein
LWIVIKGAMPAVVTYTMVPLLLFYSALFFGSVLCAIAVSVTYAYALSVCQYVRRGRISGMLLVTAFMATGRAVAAVASGHTDVYFAVPIFETAGFGLMFIATMFSAEPLVVRLARDLVPQAADDIARRRSLVKRLSLIWTAVYLASGTTTLVLLATVPLPVYLGAHTLTGWFWTGSGVLGSVVLCRANKTNLIGDPIPRQIAALPVLTSLAPVPLLAA